MIVGVPREIKTNENRVGLVVDSVRELTARGHRVVVESGAGQGIGVGDEGYRAVGAEILPGAAAVFEAAELIVKVKEPQRVEYERLRHGQTLFTYLHLAPDPGQARGLIKAGCTAIAYETVTGPDGGLPLLKPMSEVAGRMAVQIAAYFAQDVHTGAGLLLGGVPGVPQAKVVILGAGTAGSNALAIAVGLGAEVAVLDRNLERLRGLEALYHGRINTIFSTEASVETHLLEADVVIGAVLLPGKVAPKLISRELIARMKNGAVFVDISVDQGGCAETTRPTTHENPTFMVDGVLHYCVANMPGGVARTSAYALNHATLPFVLALADQGTEAALREDPHLLAGLNVTRGAITHPGVAEGLGLPCVPPLEALGKA